MYTLYQQPHHRNWPYLYDEDAYRDDYYRALAAQQARERREAQLEDTIRRRAYQEQLARAQEAERRRRRAGYNSFMGGFDLQDDYDPYSNFQFTRHDQDDMDDYLGGPIQPRQVMPPRRSPSMEAPPSLRRKASLVPPEVRASPRKKSPSPFKQRTPSPKPVVQERAVSPPRQQALPIPSPKLAPRDQAARKIQSFLRTQLPRLKSLNQIRAIALQFENLTSQFTFPVILDFSESETSPRLLFTPRNAPLHGHDHALVKLLSKLDAVESHGDDAVRKARKQLVNRIERELAMLDEKKMEAWKASRVTLPTPATSLEPSPSPGDAEMLDATVDTPISDAPMVETVADIVSGDDSGYNSFEAEAKDQKVVKAEQLPSEEHVTFQ